MYRARVLVPHARRVGHRPRQSEHLIRVRVRVRVRVRGRVRVRVRANPDPNPNPDPSLAGAPPRRGAARR